MARGFLNKPTKENAKPINQMINQVKVFQKKTLVNRARIKPVIPMPFKRCAFFMIFGELPVKTIFSLVQKISIEQAYNCRKCQICITVRQRNLWWCVIHAREGNDQGWMVSTHQK
jgi:hypothetical protein